MKTYDQLRFSLLIEFKLKAEPHLQSLWSDLAELEAASDEFALCLARGHALQRLTALSASAGAVNAKEVRRLSRALGFLVATTTQVRDAANYERFDALYRKARKLTEAINAIHVPPPVSELERQPSETVLVLSCAD
jgi:hypothetical protein